MQQSASVGRIPMLRLVLLLTLGLLACSSGKATHDERHDFSDSAGRECRAVLAKTSPDTPPVSEAVSCTGDVKQCSPESRPCFELSVDRESYAVRNCPACCRGSASSFVSTDCAPVVCSRDTDCIYRQATCQDGACVCPAGSCD